MQAVFERVDSAIVKDLKKTYDRRKFTVPKVLFKKTPGLAAAIAENVDLIKAIVAKQADLLEKAVADALRKGSDFKTIQEAVMAQSDKGVAYAKFVAADQVAKAYAAINRERQASAGIPGYIWSATNDAKTRPTHRLPSGRFFLWNQTMPNDTRPRDKSGKILHPGEDYRCRCGAIPAFDKSDEKLFKQNRFDEAEP
jgi:SPP1 gp7 family putative phage head morphogenesis protein